MTFTIFAAFLLAFFIGEVPLHKSLDSAVTLSTTNICHTQAAIANLFEGANNTDSAIVSQFFSGTTAPICNKFVQINLPVQDKDLSIPNDDAQFLDYAYRQIVESYNETGHWSENFHAAASGTTFVGYLECNNYASMEDFAVEFLKFVWEKKVTQPVNSFLIQSQNNLQSTNASMQAAIKNTPTIAQHTAKECFNGVVGKAHATYQPIQAFFQESAVSITNTTKEWHHHAGAFLNFVWDKKITQPIDGFLIEFQKQAKKDFLY